VHAGALMDLMNKGLRSLKSSFLRIAPSSLLLYHSRDQSILVLFLQEANRLKSVVDTEWRVPFMDDSRDNVVTPRHDSLIPIEVVTRMKLIFLLKFKN